MSLDAIEHWPKTFLVIVYSHLHSSFPGYQEVNHFSFKFIILGNKLNRLQDLQNQFTCESKTVDRIATPPFVPEVSRRGSNGREETLRQIRLESPFYPRSENPRCWLDQNRFRRTIEISAELPLSDLVTYPGREYWWKSSCIWRLERNRRITLEVLAHFSDDLNAKWLSCIESSDPIFDAKSVLGVSVVCPTPICICPP